MLTMILLLATAAAAPGVPAETVLELARADRARAREIVRELDENWDLSLVPMLLEVLYLVDFQGSDTSTRLWRLLERKTGQTLERNVWLWLQWLWSQQYQPHPEYAAFKAEFYAPLDERFRWWFRPGAPHTIRLDEVVWGGVRVDGIPPLDYPKFLEADEAEYLEDGNVVFGVYVNGEARAYPKRILAWHELFNDTVGGVPVTCAYCTLCGAAVLYRQQVGERRFEFGTSGFLYRSNKLMYDRTTRSLWSALEGVPVIGPLVGEGLRLERLPIVTTTWGAWRERHPSTRVLSLETGHRRDYAEGVAYRDYFATDDPMFPVPRRDGRLRHKQEVLAVTGGPEPVAFSVDFLRGRPVHHDAIGDRAVVVLTDASGASRVYESADVTFQSWDGASEAVDSAGTRWSVREEGLLLGTRRLGRLAAHRAFWFGWYAQFPGTRLVR